MPRPPVSTATTASVGRPRRFDPETEVDMIVKAALSLLRRNDYEDVSVVAILNETGLSTRSFYRHFASKDELLCAMYRQNAEGAARRLVDRVSAAGTPREALEAWIDELLALAYEPRRAERVAIFSSPGAQRAVGYAKVSANSTGELIEPLVAVLERGRADGTFPLAEPSRDAKSIHALVWDVMAWDDGGLGPERLSRPDARAHVLRFALAGLGAEESA